MVQVACVGAGGRTALGRPPVFPAPHGRKVHDVSRDKVWASGETTHVSSGLVPLGLR